MTSFQNCLSSRLSLFQKNYKVIGIDLVEQQALDADAKAYHHANLTGNLGQGRNTIICFIIKEEKATFFFAKNCDSFVNLNCFDITSL